MHAAKRLNRCPDFPADAAQPGRPLRSKRPSAPPLSEAALGKVRLDRLREALRRNAITFPSQVPVFERQDRPDLQSKIAQLFFVLGWTCGEIAVRYGIVRSRVGQILKAWTRCALEMGYIQLIPPPESAVAPLSSSKSVAATPLLPAFLVTHPAMERVV